ncbi:MAG: hypothetical protein HY020_04215 [Burkholderiales bacterium]|nr:hypothetical protein [Burkholderiales bacterium]
MTQALRTFVRSTVALNLLLFSACAAVAQVGAPSKFVNTQINVLSAETFLDSPKREFVVGENIKLVHPVRRGEAMPRVSLRFFPTAQNSLIPTELAFHNPCYVYVSLLMDVFIEKDGTIYINPPTKSWLRAVPGIGLETSYFTLVFERAAAEPEFGYQLFRLNGGDREDYFAKQGFMIAVKPGSAKSTEAELREQANWAAVSWSENVKTAQTVNDNKHECRWLKLKTVQSNGEKVLVAQADSDCEPITP